MSLQKAYVICKRCYDKLRSTEERYAWQAYEHQVQAMTALEEAGRAMTPLMDVPNKNIDGLVKNCLDACMNCDFKSSKIVELIDAAKKDPDRETQ